MKNGEKMKNIIQYIAVFCLLKITVFASDEIDEKFITQKISDIHISAVKNSSEQAAEDSIAISNHVEKLITNP